MLYFLYVKPHAWAAPHWTTTVKKILTVRSISCDGHLSLGCCKKKFVRETSGSLHAAPTSPMALELRWMALCRRQRPPVDLRSAAVCEARRSAATACTRSSPNPSLFCFPSIFIAAVTASFQDAGRRRNSSYPVSLLQFIAAIPSPFPLRPI